MIRLIGILTGSAIAVGLLIGALGMPGFSEPKPKPIALAVPTDESVTVELHTPSVDDAEPPVTEPTPPAPELTDEQLVEQIFAPQPEPVLDEQWYAFWSPFRSEIAANGFVSRLQQTTGMDYRVVKLKPGVYEVAFAYSDQDDIEQKLARISAATGLDMSGG